MAIKMGVFTNKNYWAFIIGGSSGLGLASAKKLASSGMNICIVYRASRAENIAFEKELAIIESFPIKTKTFNINALEKDKIDFVISDLKSTFTKQEKIKVLIHSIARGNLKPLVTEKDEYTLGEDDFALTLYAMASNYVSWVQRVFTNQLFDEKARLISFTSEGSQRAWKTYAAVGAAKSALESISRSMALEMAPFGITSNIIQAGVTITPSLKKIPTANILINESLKRNPFKRLTTPDDVANAVYLLCLEEANWINGNIIKVDGGEQIV
jgi:enoyl-[acyl-carrier protein] reductase III